MASIFLIAAGWGSAAPAQRGSSRAKSRWLRKWGLILHNEAEGYRLLCVGMARSNVVLQA